MNARLVFPVLAAVIIAGCQGSDAALDDEIGATLPAPTVADSKPVADPSSSLPPTTTEPTESEALSEDSCLSPVESESYEIEVWYSLSTDSETKLLELTDRFNGLGTNVTVSLVNPGNYYQTFEAVALASPNERPDAVMIDHKGTRTFADSGLFVPPRDCDSLASNLDGLLPVIEATYTLDEELLAVPYNVSTPLLMFDKVQVADAGLDPSDPPQTLDELSTAAGQIVDSGVAPFGFVAYDGYGPWFITQFNSRRGELSGIEANGHSGHLIEVVDFATPSIISTFEWLRAEVDEGRALWIGGNPSGFDDLLRVVNEEEGAPFTMSTSGAIGDVLRGLEAGSFPGVEMGVSPMPGPGKGGLVGGGAFWLLGAEDPSRVGATAEYLDWLIQPAQHSEFAAFTGFSPLGLSELTEPVLRAAWEANPQLRVGFDQLVDLPGDDVHAGPAWGAGTEINRVMYEAMASVVEGADVVEQLERATLQVNTLLADYNGLEGS